MGSGSRFESITRGVIDLRDLYYYLSLTGVFLALTVYSLERLRWAADSDRPADHHRIGIITTLAVANLLAANLWLNQVGEARADLTEGRLYTLSDASRTYLGQLREPLLIRGYFSAETHPLLAPLVPQIRDLLREYEVAGQGQVRVEVVDPADHPDLEREAGEQYGIRPVAFQTASKYQAAVVSSYFDLVVKYGDQFERLGFQDLIDVKIKGETDLDVRLRNPEYDITRSIKKVLYGYQGGGDLFAGIGKPVRLRAFVSAPETLPEPLPALRQDLEAVLAGIQSESAGRFEWSIQDPAADPALAKEIEERYGFQPLVIGLLDPVPFYFYLALESGERAEAVPLPESLDKAGLERAIEAGIKRFAPGVLRTLAVYTPPAAPDQFGMPGQASSYSLVQEGLRDGFDLRDTDLSSGQVPEEADLLLVLGPDGLDDKQQFAIDQFLMQGGTVILAASSFHVDLGGGTISASPRPTGLEDWLDHQGLGLAPLLVLDPQNTPFPIPVQRNLGGFVVEEIQTLDYPYFPDVRADGLAEDSGITANLGQITMNWSSPIQVDPEVYPAPGGDGGAGRTLTRLIESSGRAWTSDSTNMQPDFGAHGALGFPRGEDPGRKLLAVSVEGRFTSAFAGKPSPLLREADAESSEGGADDAAGDAVADDADGEAAEGEAKTPVISGVIEGSPSSARLILIGSDAFATDTAISLATEATQSRYLKPVELIANAVEWSLEDRGLLALRGRGQFSRLLEPVGREGRMVYEYLNYGLALGGLALVYWLARRARARRVRAQARYLKAEEV